jgi:hypothetical protein
VLGFIVESGNLDLTKQILSTIDQKQSLLPYSEELNIESASILFGQAEIWWMLSNGSIVHSTSEGDSGRYNGGDSVPDTNQSKTLSSWQGSIVLERKLGSGHFGDVWQGKKGEKRIAVKLLQRASEEGILEMLEEISLLG